jgi:hypothetical protein
MKCSISPSGTLTRSSFRAVGKVEPADGVVPWLVVDPGGPRVGRPKAGEGPLTFRPEFGHLTPLAEIATS